MPPPPQVSLHPPFGVATVPYTAPPAGEEAAVVFLTAGIGITTAVPLSSLEIETGRRKVRVGPRPLRRPLAVIDSTTMRDYATAAAKLS